MNRPLYQIEVKFNKGRWTLVETKNNQSDALAYIKDKVNDLAKYPIRIVQVHRKIVFDSEK